MAQGDVANAKDDTRLYATGASITACTTDLSHQADNLTAGTGCVFEASSSRWDYTTVPWAIDVVCTANSTDAGRLYQRESGAAGIRLEVVAGPIVRIRVNTTLVASVTLSGIAGTREGLVVTWSAEPNVFTTGASDAVRSVLRVFNTTDGTYAQAVATHAVPTAALAQAIWGAALTGGGAGANIYTGVITQIRWSVGRFHPAAESREDFIANTAAPTLAFATRREVPVPTRASGIGDDGWFAGPVAMATAAGLHQLDLRQAGAIVSECYRDAPTLNTAPPAVRALASPDGDGATFYMQFLKHRPVPITTNRLLVRVHVQAWRVDASPPDTIHVRCYSMSRPPGPGVVNGIGALPWNRFYVEQTVNSADGSGSTGGNWYTFDPLMVARDKGQQGTWLCLAFSVDDDGGGGRPDQRWRIRAWTVEPGAMDSAGEIPLGGIGAG